MKPVFSNRAKNIRASEIREILKLTSRSDIISFAGGLPAPDCFPIDQLKGISKEVLQDMGVEALQYNATEGYLPLREKIAKRMQKQGMDAKADNILMTSGSQQGLDFSGKIFTDPGDIVLCESPSYLGAINAFKAYGAEFVEVDTDENGMIPEDLEAKLEKYDRVRMIYVIPDFQNPTGRTWSVERRKALLSLAKKYNKVVIEDNPYGELRYEGESLPSVYALDKDDLVVYLGTFSKTFCPGLRIGWVCASDEILNKYILVKQGADLHSNAMAQRELSLFLDHYDFDAHIDRLVKLYRHRRDIMVDALDKYFPKDIKYVKPEGGLFLWLEVSDKIDTKPFLQDAIKEGVAFVPGNSFFPNGGVDNGMRLNFSNMDDENIEAGMARLGALLKNL